MRGMGSRATFLDQERTFGIDCRLGSVVLDPPLPFPAEKIETETVVVQICEYEQFGSKGDPLIVGEQTFEDGVLDPLPVILAGPGDPAKPSLPGAGGGGDVVADKDHHGRGQT